MSTVAEEIEDLDRQIALITERRDRFTVDVIRFLNRLEDPEDSLEAHSVNRVEIVEVLAAWRQFEADGAL